MVLSAMEREAPERFVRPFPVMRGGPELGSRHRCMSLIRLYQRDGYIHNCVHAHAAVVETSRHDGSHYYGVRCARDSFDIRLMPQGSFGPNISSDARGFYGCPPACHYRRGPWLDRLLRLRDNVRPFHWLDRQPWQVKVAVLLAPLWAFLIYRGPETIRALTELVKAALSK